MATSLALSPRTARSVSLSAQGCVCMGGGRSDTGILDLVHWYFFKHKEKQTSRMFITKLILALHGILAIKDKTCITCICWGHEVFLITFPKVISGLSTQINPSMKDIKTHTPPYNLFSVLLALCSPRLLLSGLSSEKYLKAICSDQKLLVYASIYISVKCSSHFVYNIQK